MANDYMDESRGDYKTNAEENIEKGIKFAGNKVKGAIKHRVKQAVWNGLKAFATKVLPALLTNPITWVVLLALIMLLFIFSKYSMLTETLQSAKKGITHSIALLLNWDEYDEAKSQAWNDNGTDPDKTYLLYSIFNAVKEGTLEYEDTALAKDNAR